MTKFESQDRALSVLSVSQRLPCFLNRQVVTLLETQGVPASVCMALQEDMLDRLRWVGPCMYVKGSFPVSQEGIIA